jgi:hypothetical protein
VIIPSPTEIEDMGETSITIPSVDERPAKQWPPLRGTTWRPIRRAKASVSETSVGVVHRTTACGRRWSKVAIAGRRTAS